MRRSRSVRFVRDRVLARGRPVAVDGRAGGRADRPRRRRQGAGVENNMTDSARAHLPFRLTRTRGSSSAVPEALRAPRPRHHHHHHHHRRHHHQHRHHHRHHHRLPQQQADAASVVVRDRPPPFLFRCYFPHVFFVFSATGRTSARRAPLISLSRARARARTSTGATDAAAGFFFFPRRLCKHRKRVISQPRRCQLRTTETRRQPLIIDSFRRDPINRRKKKKQWFGNLSIFH